MLSVAMKCFDENRRIFGDANREPEKFNLYNGLYNLAKGVADLEEQVEALKREVQYRK